MDGRANSGAETDTIVPGLASETSTVARNFFAKASTMLVPRPEGLASEAVGIPTPLSRTDKAQSGPLDR